MSKTRTVRRYTDGSIEKSRTISRDTYKRVKHMDKVEMTAYLEALYAKGYEAGYNAAIDKIAAETASTVTDGQV